MSEAREAGAGSMDRPLDPELWEMTRTAVFAAGVTADRYLDNGGWRPRVRLPNVGSFDSGWPNTSWPPFAPDNAPTDYSALFGRKRDQLKPIAYGDVEALASLLSYVRGRDDLRTRLGVELRTGRKAREDWLIDLEVVDLPLSLLDRARATNVTTSEELLRLYVHRERAWLQDPLPVEYVIPLALTAIDPNQMVVIDAMTRIEPLDRSTQAARAPESSSIGSVPEPVIGAATHAIVLSGHYISNPGPNRRHFGREDEAPPLADADLVCEALRVVSRVGVGYAQVLRRPVGWADIWVHDLPAISTMATVRQYPDSFDDYGWLHPLRTIPEQDLKPLPQISASLRAAPSNVRLAARRLSLACLRAADDDRTVDACIGLEAVLGDGQDELSHRLALRAATALATRPNNPAKPHTVYDMTKKVYKHRSAVVHGTSGAKSRLIQLGEETYQAADVAVLLLREVLTDALTRQPGWTPEALDGTLLAALAALSSPSDDSTATQGEAFD
jgi:hypothetical protein